MGKFKSLLITFLLLIAFLPFVNSAEFFVVNVSPSEFYPGQETILNITLKNLGIDYAAKLKASLDPDDVSPVDAIGPWRKYVGMATEAEETKCFGVVAQREKINLIYPIKIKTSAREGVYSVPLVLEWQFPTPENQTILFGIIVKEAEPFIVVEKDELFAEPGTTLTYNIKIKNTGDVSAEDVEIIFHNISHFSILSADRLKIEKINPNNEIDLQVKILIDTNLKPGLYSLPMSLSYSDISKKIYNLKATLPILIKGRAKLDIAGISTTPSQIFKGENAVLQIKIENIGDSDAKSVSAVLQYPGFSKKAYLGKIEKDDNVPAIFFIKPEKSGPLNYTLTLEYVDDLGQHTKTVNNTLYIYAPKNDKTYISFVIVVVFALLVVGYLLFRRRHI
jgi:hypothetical protein